MECDKIQHWNESNEISNYASHLVRYVKSTRHEKSIRVLEAGIMVHELER
jgi:hypothetical protein